MDQDKRKEILEKHLKDFGAKLKIVANQVIGEVEADYLPYLEDDLELNVPSFARDIVRRFLEGKKVDGMIFDELEAKEIRQRIFFDNQTEIIAAIEKDIDMVSDARDCIYGPCDKCKLGIRTFPHCPYLRNLNRHNEYKRNIQEALNPIREFNDDGSFKYPDLTEIKELIGLLEKENARINETDSDIRLLKKKVEDREAIWLGRLNDADARARRIGDESLTFQGQIRTQDKTITYLKSVISEKEEKIETLTKANEGLSGELGRQSREIEKLKGDIDDIMRHEVE